MEKELPTYYLSTAVFLRSPDTNNWFDANTFIQSIYSSLHIFYIVHILKEFNLLFQLSNYFYKWNIADAIAAAQNKKNQSIECVCVCVYRFLLYLLFFPFRSSGSGTKRENVFEINEREKLQSSAKLKFSSRV